MFLFRKSKTSSPAPTVEKLSLVPHGAVNTKNPSPSDFIIGKLGITPTKVTGEVVLNYPNNAPIKLKRIEIALRGQCTLRWTEEAATSDNYVRSVRLKRKVLLDRKLVLWESTVGEYIEMTSDRFPFSVNLPSTLLSSMKNDDADVTYSLEAIVTRSKRVDDDVKRILIDLPLINHSAFLDAIMAASASRSSPIRLRLPQHHVGQGMTWECTVNPAGCVYRGEKVTVDMTLSLPPHLKHVKAKYVFLALKERVVVYDDSGRERSSHVRYVTEPHYTDIGYVNTGCKLTRSIERPLTGMSDTGIFSSHISISHSVEFKLAMNSNVKDIEAEAPLYFSSMTRDEAQQAIAARGEAFTATTATTAAAAAAVVSIDYYDAPPPYERGNWMPNSSA